MNLSQTLPGQSPTFSSFQPSSSLALHYPLDNSQSPSLAKLHHHANSPLQPLHLNGLSATSQAPNHALHKPQNGSLSHDHQHSSDSYLSPTAKPIQFSTEEPTSAQRQLSCSSQPSQSTQHRQNPQEETNSQVSVRESTSNYSFPICIQSSCKEVCGCPNVRQNVVNVNKMKEETLKETRKKDCEDSIRHQSETSESQQENQDMSHFKSDNPFRKALHTKNIEDIACNMRVAGTDKSLQDLSGLKEEPTKLNIFPQQKMSSERLFSHLKGNDNKEEPVIYEDSGISRLKASSVGDGIIEGFDIFKDQIYAQRPHQPCMQEIMQTKMQITEQNNLPGGILKPKKVRQCLNVLCFTDPKDPALWSKQKVMNSMICKACFDAFKHNQYCFFCYQIYIDGDTSASNDGKDWIECDGCNRWNHIECEAVHGLADIRNLLKGHENTFTYYCPVCRNDKAAKAASKRLKAFMTAPTLIKTTSVPKQVTYKKTVRKNTPPIYHPNPMVEDILDFDNGVVEPFGKKVKTESELPGSLILNPMNSMEKVKEEKENITTSLPLSAIDLARKKLDSIFLRNQIKKKPLRVHLLSNEVHFNDIDKLMSQYAGKRVQLTENEIKADLDLFRGLSKTSTCHTDEKSNGSDYGMDASVEQSEDKSNADYMEEYTRKLTVRKRNSKPRGIESIYSDTNSRGFEDMVDDEDSRGYESYEPRRQLRSRRRFDDKL